MSFLKARPSFGAMRQESRGCRTASSEPLEIVTAPSSTTYIFSIGEASSVVPPPGARVEIPSQSVSEGPASRPCSRTIRMSVCPGAS